MKRHRFLSLFALLVLLAVGFSACRVSGPETFENQPVVPVQQPFLHRISQLDRAQYASAEEHHLWSGSTCSTAAMTMVMNYHGKQLRITDVLREQQSIPAISPELGLLYEKGIIQTVQEFGFQATVDHEHSLDQVIALANSGKPVIVSFPPQKLYPSGHLLVVTGGNAYDVFLADSSTQNLTVLPRIQFAALWSPDRTYGLTAIVTP